MLVIRGVVDDVDGSSVSGDVLQPASKERQLCFRRCRASCINVWFDVVQVLVAT